MPFQDVKLWRADGSALVANNANGELVMQQKDLIPITNTGASGAGVTLTIPAPGAGISAYIAYLQVVLYAAAALTGGATPIVVTTTNLPNSPALTFPTALAIGQTAEQKFEGVGSMKATVAATAVTIVCPAVTGGIWRVNASYFLA